MIVVQTVVSLLVVGVLVWFIRGVMYFMRKVEYTDLFNERFSDDRLFTFLSRDVVVDIMATMWPLAPWIVHRVLAVRWQAWKLHSPPSMKETARGALRRPLPNRPSSPSESNPASG